VTLWQHLRTVGCAPSTLFEALSFGDANELIAGTRRPGTIVDLAFALGAEPGSLLATVQRITADVSSAATANRWAAAGVTAVRADDRHAVRFAVERVVEALEGADGPLADAMRQAFVPARSRAPEHAGLSIAQRLARYSSSTRLQPHAPQPLPRPEPTAASLMRRDVDRAIALLKEQAG
jgi:hypothetical protein